MRTRNEIVSWCVVVVASVGLHAVAFGGIAARPDGFRGKNARPTTLVEMSVAKPKDEPPPSPKPVQASAPRSGTSRPARAAAHRAIAAPTAPAAEPLADFTGVTMTNDAPGAGWSSATGNGQTMTGPVGRIGARRSIERSSSATGGDAGPAVVAVADLSRRPSAPDLTQALAHAYPEDARKKGTAGRAIIRARITADGHVAEAVILSESTRGFGVACQRTLRDSIWSPPLDRSAHAVSTLINYTCRFEVQ